MARIKYIEQARTAYATLCRSLDELEVRYKKIDDELKVECNIRGEDLEMDISFEADPIRGLMLLLSPCPFAVQEDKRVDVALAVTLINDRLVDGSFDYNIKSGAIFFRMTNCFIESELSPECFSYMLICACQTIDKYNDKLLMVAKGVISLQQFLSMIND